MISDSLPSRRNTLKARDRVGKYKIQRRLGQGGFATVYRALDTVEGVPVALKVPHPHLVTDETMAQFRREARLHARLDHPNILAVKNVEELDGHFVIAYPAGERSLAERLHRRMGLETFLSLAEQMLEAVAYAHAQGIMHLDLKPENFILFPDNRLRLSDFSISKVAARTMRGSGSGTLGYIAPEQAMGRASFRSDVFALGLIFYEMLTRELPEWPFRWPLPGHDKLRRRVHPDFIALLRRAIDVDPARRFADGGAMLAAFRRLKPKLRRFVVGARRRRRRRSTARPGWPRRRRRRSTTRPDWQRIRFRQCLRDYRGVFALDRACGHCDGPMSEPMVCCPWCGEEPSHDPADTKFPAHCGECGRGRKLDWRFCAWCYGPGFDEVATRSYSDKRYTASCKSCRGELMPFMRYCPWCRRKVRTAWKVHGVRDKCGSCGCSVAAEYWDHCPWCARTL